MFIPNRFKYKKQQKGKEIAKIKNSFCKIYKNNNKTYLKSLQYGHMTVNHLKTLKLQISKNIKKWTISIRSISTNSCNKKTYRSSNG
jgi:hypothetical protein